MLTSKSTQIIDKYLEAFTVAQLQKTNVQNVVKVTQFLKLPTKINYYFSASYFIYGKK